MKLKRFWLLMSIALPATVLGQAARPTAEPLFKTVSGGFIAFSVPNLQASVQWYSEKMGLKVVMEVPPRDGTAVAVLEGGGLIVELVQLERAVPLSKAAPAATGPQFVHGIFKAGLVVDDFDRTVAALRTRGVEIAFGPFPARDNQRANVIIKDRDGNHIQLFAR